MKTNVTFYCGSGNAVASDYTEDAVAQIKSQLRDGEDIWLTSSDGQITFVRFANVAVVAFRPIEDERGED